MKKKTGEIDHYKLDQSFHRIHKEKLVASALGLDNTQELNQGGLGL